MSVAFPTTNLVKTVKKTTTMTKLAEIKLYIERRIEWIDQSLKSGYMPKNYRDRQRIRKDVMQDILKHIQEVEAKK